MKKFRCFALILIFALLMPFIPFFSKTEVFAEQNIENQTVSTGIFLPTSYLQYYKLDNPFAICRYLSDDEEFVAISHKDEIVVYCNEKFAKIPLDLDGKSVSVLQRYENYLLFLYKSTIHTIDITDFENENWSGTPKNTGIICNNSFSIYGNEIVYHDSNYIYKSKIKSDLSGGFDVDISTSIQVDEDLTAMVHLSKTGNIYYSKVDADGIFVFDGNQKSVFYPQAKNVSAITESDDGKSIYYSCPYGVFSIDVESKTISTVCESSDLTVESDLGNLYSPRGICYLGNKLWVVDNSINAVQEIDLTTNSFTQFAITTNSQAINRLSENVQDIVVDKDKIYALDKNRIVVINDINNAERTYNRINLPTPISKFSAGNGFICYSNESTVSVCKLTQNPDDQNIFDLTDIQSTTLSDIGTIEDISFSEGIFYVIRTVILNDGISHPIVYAIDTTKETLLLEPILSDLTAEGYAKQVVADVFGTVYYCSEKDNNYEFYSYDGNQVKLINTFNKTTPIRNLQTDFDGKLYSLLDDNKIVIVTEDGVTPKTLETSQNLGNIKPAKSMCLSCNSETAYFIFEGLILSSSVSSDLDISTPHTIDVPEGFNLNFDVNQKFANVKQGAKLFEIDITNLNGEHFIFKDYADAKSDSQNYAVKVLNDKYSLLICDGVSAVARNSDIQSTFEPTDIDVEKYAVVSFTTYTLPVLQSPYKSNEQIEKFSTVKIVAEINFNGVNYFVVERNGSFGYIPDTFLTDTVILTEEQATAKSAYVYKKDGVKIYDKDGIVIDTLKTKTKVCIVAFGDKLTIIYNGSIAYVDSSAVVTNSNSEILKSIAVFLATLSICITALFFEKRFLLKK